MSVIDRLISLYAPHACVGCGDENSVLCGDCATTLPRSLAVCYKCGQQSQGGKTCLPCRSDSPLVSVNSFTPYQGAAKEVLAMLKFKRALAAAESIGVCMAQAYGAAIADDVLIVPVPTARKRVRGRGYDQSVLIAKHLARHCSGTYAPLLIRLGSQEQKGAGRSQRQTQLSGAYVVKSPERLKDARVLLVDDVITTGSTLEEVARVLQPMGVTAIGALVFARA